MSFSNLPDVFELRLLFSLYCQRDGNHEFVGDFLLYLHRRSFKSKRLMSQLILTEVCRVEIYIETC